MKLEITKDRPDRIVTDLYVWIAIDPKTNLEGIGAISIPDGTMQAVTSNYGIALRMGPVIREVAKQTGMIMRLIRFSDRTDITDDIGKLTRQTTK